MYFIENYLEPTELTGWLEAGFDKSSNIVRIEYVASIFAIARAFPSMLLAFMPCIIKLASVLLSRSIKSIPAPEPRNVIYCPCRPLSITTELSEC